MGPNNNVFFRNQPAAAGSTGALLVADNTAPTTLDAMNSLLVDDEQSTVIDALN